MTAGDELEATASCHEAHHRDNVDNLKTIVELRLRLLAAETERDKLQAIIVQSAL